MQTCTNTVPHRTSMRYFLSAGMIAVLCLLSSSSFSQSVDIVNPANNSNYKLPDPTAMKTAAEAEAAIRAAETAAKALNADAAKERVTVLSLQPGVNKARVMGTDYVTALNNFSKNDVVPYNTDMNNYTASGTKFTGMLASYNKAVQAYNALPAKDRKAATAAALNKQKVQIDALGAKLSQWKTKLDAAKAKLDVKNAALQKQNQKQEAATKTVSEKVKVSKDKLVRYMVQLNTCATYAGKCRLLLTSKFSYANKPDTGFFAGPVYRNAISDIDKALKN
jgi:hypothetical protein